MSEQERKAFIEGDVDTAELLAYIEELEGDIDELEYRLDESKGETLQEWIDNFGSVEAHHAFFIECLIRLGVRVIDPDINDAQHKQLIFDAIERGRPC